MVSSHTFSLGSKEPFDILENISLIYSGSFVTLGKSICQINKCECKYAHLISCWDTAEKINPALMSVPQRWSPPAPLRLSNLQLYLICLIHTKSVRTSRSARGTTSWPGVVTFFNRLNIVEVSFRGASRRILWVLDRARLVVSQFPALW